MRVPPNSCGTVSQDGLVCFRWVAELMVEKPTVEEAIAMVQRMEESIQAMLPIEPIKQ